MTLCVAAVCDSGGSISCVYDAQLSIGYTSGEVLKKAARVNPYWAVMFAGDDISKVGTIIDRVKMQLLEASRSLDYEDVRASFVETFRGVLREKIEALVLAHLGLTHDKFIKTGRTVLGPEVFADRCYAAAQVNVGAQFLVAGFDSRQLPHIFAVVEGGEVLNFDRGCFGAIGSGALVAEHMLLFHDYKREWDLPVAVYHLCAAKFMAERAMLGKATLISVLRFDGSVLTTDADAVRDLWSNKGRPKQPDDLMKRMPVFRPIEDDRKESTSDV